MTLKEVDARIKEVMAENKRLEDRIHEFVTKWRTSERKRAEVEELIRLIHVDLDKIYLEPGYYWTVSTAKIDDAQRNIINKIVEDTPEWKKVKK